MTVKEAGSADNTSPSLSPSLSPLLSAPPPSQSLVLLESSPLHPGIPFGLGSYLHPLLCLEPVFSQKTVNLNANKIDSNSISISQLSLTNVTR